VAKTTLTQVEIDRAPETRGRFFMSSLHTLLIEKHSHVGARLRIAPIAGHTVEPSCALERAIGAPYVLRYILVAAQKPTQRRATRPMAQIAASAVVLDSALLVRTVGAW
jgi:hypothetical protein